jgi:hypothetical protein
MDLIVDNVLSCVLSTDEKRRSGKCTHRSSRRKVGLEALRGVKTFNEIGREFAVHPVQVGQCKKEIQEQAKNTFLRQARY